MIKYYCDICGRKIKNDDNVITVNIARKPKAFEYEYENKLICTDCESKLMNIFRKEE